MIEDIVENTLQAAAAYTLINAISYIRYVKREIMLDPDLNLREYLQRGMREFAVLQRNMVYQAVVTANASVLLF